MTANYLVCNIEDTSKRAEYKIKTQQNGQKSH